MLRVLVISGSCPSLKCSNSVVCMAGNAKVLHPTGNGVNYPVFFQKKFERRRKVDALMLNLPNVKQNVAPPPLASSVQIRPRCRSTMARAMARPLPTPGYSDDECNRWNAL